ncbi:MAG: CoB--CoM heterodisulfide reductase iron-sulfur subunit B family protein [Candidatus Fermentibacteraceae bacterium]|nr:CoB--CoM heterodisulfide reductase iron-sulfur subunit B family protein [Candidatus Fermentibacteraceae bacterium]MBN2608826.1 CoB--CoM heterodisulfide reductase iron-sulfur subunit B family protein [Candidatus Fermentibacteraceae bacterium]
MAKVAYYPGCALKERSSHLDTSARDSAVRLGFELDELPTWTCCGAVPPVSEERVMNLVAPSRILKDVRDSGRDVLITICDFCYNTLKRTNYSIRTNEITRKRINAFLADDEPERDYIEKKDAYWVDYTGEVRVVHLMEYLRDEIGYGNIREKLKRPLSGLKIAPYYGCVMLRPQNEIQLDEPENPSIIEDFIDSLGAETIRYPYRTECCGSYLSVSSPDASTRLCYRILTSAQQHGADAMVISCPLCFYNLDSRQKAIAEAYPDFKPIPVFYFTQLLSVALGVDEGRQGFERHFVDVAPVLDMILQGSGKGDRT